jgi:hypothetical protein
VRPGREREYRPRLLLPALPRSRALPWVLGCAAVVALAFGLAAGQPAVVTAGAVGLGGVVVAFPLAGLILGREPVEPPSGDSGEP